jgi:hypothetical protein
VWSGTFSDKCIAPGGGVRALFTPFEPHNKLVIKEARVQNTTDLIPQRGEVNLERIREHPPTWKVTFKDTTKGFNRLVVNVAAPPGARKIRVAQFFCQSQRGVVLGELKERIPAPTPTAPDNEVWSATFSSKCVGGVRVVLFPVNPARNRVEIKSAFAVNTTHTTPREGPANAELKAKSMTFKVTSKATFAANRVEVDVGSATAATKVRAARFICQRTEEEVAGELKRIDTGVNPGALPNHEVWSADFSTKCITAPTAADPGSGVTVILVPVDPDNQLEIKKARVQNVDGGEPTPTPTPPPDVKGNCDKGDQGVPIDHDSLQPGFYDIWKCTPDVSGLDWNRVDIFIGNPTATQKVKAVQFDCQDNESKATVVAKKAPEPDPNGQWPSLEVWSGENFKEEAADGTVITKNCRGAVTVAVLPWDPDNHPEIKKALFSHVGEPKPPPPKFDQNGVCTQVANDEWLCVPFSGVPPYNRIDIKVAGQPDAFQMAGGGVSCNGGIIGGFFEIKGRKQSDDPAAPFPFHEVWSVDMDGKCDGQLVVVLQPLVAGTPLRILSITFSNTTSNG